MRYSDRVTLVGAPKRVYDPVTGDMVVIEGERTYLPCNISDVGIKRTNELFGRIDRHITVVRLQQPYHDHVEELWIGDKRFNILRKVNHRTETSFYVEGV